MAIDSTWKIERLEKRGLLRITMDIQLDKVPFYLLKEFKGIVKTENFKESHVHLFNTLTSREREILSFITKHYYNKEIADELNIALNTIKTHRKNIMHKLQCNSMTELMKYRAFTEEENESI